MRKSILQASDWHLDAVTAGLHRFDDVEAAVEETLQAAREAEVDLYAFTGDAADADCGPVGFRVSLLMLDAAQRLSDWGIASVWVAGNHDVAEDGHGTTVLTPLRALRDHHCSGSGAVFVCEEPNIIDLPGLRVVALPFPSRSNWYDPAAYVGRWVQPRQGCAIVSMGHLTIDNALIGSESREMARGRDLQYPIDALQRAAGGSPLLMLNGHYHARQQPGGIYVPGSLARLRHDEEGNEPGYNIYEVETCPTTKAPAPAEEEPTRYRSRRGSSKRATS